VICIFIELHAYWESAEKGQSCVFTVCCVFLLDGPFLLTGAVIDKARGKPIIGKLQLGVPQVSDIAIKQRCF
jgi:hypothetical protein